MATIKNLQSMEKLLEICTGLGENYKPGQQKLQVEAMTTLLSQAQTLVNAADAAQTVHNRATNNREVLFSDLGKLATRMLSALIASGATPQNVDDARALVRKLTGQRPIDRATVPSQATAQTTTPAPVQRARGRDFASRVRTFQQLVGMLEAEPNYQPKEAALQLGDLKSKLQALSENNSEVIQLAEGLRQARVNRDAVLYKQSNSVYQVGQLAKVYVKSAFGFGSDTQLAVRKLPFDPKHK
jgi:hypothetical protein